MTSADTRALRRIDKLAKVSPEAVELSRYASLAVRVDAPLLRRLRLAFMPGSDAGVEADLWFSDLSESRDDEGLVFDGHVAAVLQPDRLAGALLAGPQPHSRSRCVAAASHCVARAVDPAR